MSEKILKRLQKTVDNHSKTLDNHTKILDKHSKILDNHTKILNQHTEQLNRVIVAVVKNQEEIKEIKETMATKDDIARIATTLDTLVGLYNKTDQEVTFMGERVNRVEEDVARIKPLVGLA